MIILSGYEKVKMAGVFGYDIDNKASCEIFENEDDFYQKENPDNSQNDNYPQKSEQELDKNQDAPKPNETQKKTQVPKITNLSAKKGIDFLTPKTI
jgi:hypothetical protein